MARLRSLARLHGGNEEACADAEDGRLFRARHVLAQSDIERADVCGQKREAGRHVAVLGESIVPAPGSNRGRGGKGDFATTEVVHDLVSPIVVVDLFKDRVEYQE